VDLAAAKVKRWGGPQARWAARFEAVARAAECEVPAAWVVAAECRRVEAANTVHRADSLFTSGFAAGREVYMKQTLIRSWWLLVLCGVLEGVVGLINLGMRDPSGSVLLRKLALAGIGTVVFQGKFALAAGACGLAAGIAMALRDKSWLLTLNGLALCAYGLLSIFWSQGRLAFLPVALLFVLMAMTLGAFALAFTRRLHQDAEKWLLGLAGAVSIGFGLAFLALGYRLIGFHGPSSYFLWSSSYFGFSAICTLALGLLLHSRQARLSISESGALRAS
jgi:uncharacterized membrane protein HdeD (DUF308 family)